MPAARRTIMTAEELAAEADMAGEKPPTIAPDPPKPGLSITRADELLRKPDPPVVVPTVSQASQMHECGLPLHFVGQGSKTRIVAYVAQYEFTKIERETLEITEAERALHRLYRDTVGAQAASVDYFVAALRMWRTGEFPLYRGPRLDLRKYKVETLERNKK